MFAQKMSQETRKSKLDCSAELAIQAYCYVCACVFVTLQCEQTLKQTQVTISLFHHFDEEKKKKKKQIFGKRTD